MEIIQVSQESEYNEILQRAVVVIENARSQVARAIVTTSNELHWNIGRLLYDMKIESKHGESIV